MPERRLLRQPSSLPARLLIAAAVAVAACSAAGAARAQELVLPPQPAPPPMKYLPEEVRAQLSAAASPKERVVSTLGLLEQFLARAEQYTLAQRYDPAAAELGVYQALLDDALEFLKPVGRANQGRVDSKTRDLYKRIELALNKHTARIETMRRQTPAQYAANVRAAFLYARDRRTEALESFFTETVIRPPKDSEGAHGPAKATPAKPADRPPTP